MKQHIQILILLISILSISSKTYSQVDISVRNVNRGIELCNEGKHEFGLIHLSMGLKDKELPDSIRYVGELYRQCSYIITDKSKVSYGILESILPKIKEPQGPLLIYANQDLGNWYIQQEDFDKAYLYLNQSLQECERINRKDSIEYIYSLTDIASLESKRNNLKEVDRLFEYIYKLLNNKESENYRFQTILLSFFIDYQFNLNASEKAYHVALKRSQILFDMYGGISDEYIKSLWDQYDASFVYNQEKAKVIIDSICDIQEKITGKNHHDYFTALNSKIETYIAIGDYNNALKYSNELMDLSNGTRYHILYKQQQVTILHDLGKYEEAIKKQKEIVVYYISINNTSSFEYIQSVFRLRKIYDDLSGYKKEITKLDEIIISFNFSYTPTNEELLNLLIFKLSVYKYKSYTEYSSFVKNEFKKLDSILGSDMLYQNLKCGIVEILYPDYNDAVKYIESYIFLLKENNMLKSKLGLGALFNLAELYIKNKEILKAITINEQTLAINKELYGEQSISYIEDLDFLSTIYFSLGNIEKYIILQNKMFDLIRTHHGKSSHLYIQKRVNPIYSFFIPQESSEELIEILKNNENKNLPSHIYLCLSIAYFQQEDYKNAIKYADLKLKNAITSQDSIWGLTTKMSALKQLNRWNEVEECNKQMFAIAKSKNDLEQQISCKEDLAMILYKRGDVKQAQALIKEVTLNKWENSKRTLSLLPEKERTQFWTSQTNIHYRYLPNYLSNHDFETENEFVSFILDNQLRHKGLLLNYSILFNNIDSQMKDSIYRAKFQNYRSLKLNKERLSNDELQVMNKLENELVAQSNINIDETSSVEIRERLKDNDLIVEFINYPIYGPRIIKKSEEKYAAILLKQNWEHSIIVSLPIDSVGITQRNITYSQIWEPIKDYILPDDNIYFSASGILHQIPIESLPVGDGKIMSDVYNMHRLSSTRELVKKKKEMKYTKAALYGGLNYDMTDDELLSASQTYTKDASTEYFVSRGLLEDSIRGYKWDNLSNTQQEVDYISDLLKKNQITTQTYKGNIGNEESFKALSGHEYNIIHLATHGFFYPDEEAKEKDYFKPMLLNGHYQKFNEVDMSMWRSGLVLSGGNRAWKGDSIPDTVEDGILKAQEIGDLDLRGADLVVLSACNTGQGEVTGEGVFGLQRAFKMAGAQTIVMSLTPVDDQTTMAMMNKFYTNLFSGQSKHDAFYNAQRYIRSIKPDPKYWMGWIMLD